MTKKNLFIGVLCGILLTITFLWISGKLGNFFAKQEESTAYILRNQITKMNKMVVLEQDFSSIQKLDTSYEVLGAKISNNQIVTFTKTNAQVSYDLNKMKLEVDSINKKLIIKELPNPDIRITPNVEIQSLNDSFINRIDEAQIKAVTQKAKEQAFKTVNQDQLKKMGNTQLRENLNQIFVLAKALKYEVVDDTKTFDLSNL